MSKVLSKVNPLNFVIEDNTIFYYRTKIYSKLFPITWKEFSDKTPKTLEGLNVLNEAREMLSSIGIFHTEDFEYTLYDKSLYEAFQDIGVEMYQASTWNSDLHVVNSPEVLEILKRYPLSRKNCKTFTKDGIEYLDIPFQWKPFWDRKVKESVCRTLGI